MHGKLKLERDDDEDTEALIDVFDANEKWQMDQGRGSCRQESSRMRDEQEARATLEGGGDTIIKNWTNMDVCRRERDPEGRQR